MAASQSLGTIIFSLLYSLKNCILYRLCARQRTRWFNHNSQVRSHRLKSKHKMSDIWEPLDLQLFLIWTFSYLVSQGSQLLLPDIVLRSPHVQPSFSQMIFQLLSFPSHRLSHPNLHLLLPCPPNTPGLERFQSYLSFTFPPGSSTEAKFQEGGRGGRRWLLSFALP